MVYAPYAIAAYAIICVNGLNTIIAAPAATISAPSRLDLSVNLDLIQSIFHSP